MDCTEEEAYTFAALQFQVKLAQAQTPATNVPVAKTTVDESVTDIDAALNNLQVLIGSGLLYLHCTYMYNGVCVCTCMHAYTVHIVKAYFQYGTRINILYLYCLLIIIHVD